MSNPFLCVTQPHDYRLLWATTTTAWDKGLRTSIPVRCYMCVNCGKQVDQLPTPTRGAGQ